MSCKSPSKDLNEMLKSIFWKIRKISSIVLNMPWELLKVNTRNIFCCWDLSPMKFLLESNSPNLGPVVQSFVSLTSSLRVISLTVLADSIYNILIFFAEKM